jgi:Tol biopolymer transport system component
MANDVTAFNLRGATHRVRIPRPDSFRFLSSEGRAAPDGSYFVLLGTPPSAESEVLFAVDSTGRELWRVPGNVNDVPAISPDAKRLTIVSDGRLHLYDVVSNELKPLNVAGAHPAWAPDGQRIAYDHENRVYVIDLRTGVSDLAGTGTRPSWSRDGRSLAVQVNGTTTELIELESRSRRVMLSGSWSIVPQWSPDGEWIVYSRAAAVRWSSMEGASEPQQIIVRHLPSGRESAVGRFFKANPADFHWITNQEICW